MTSRMYLFIFLIAVGVWYAAIFYHAQKQAEQWPHHIHQCRQLAVVWQIGYPLLSGEAPHLRHLGYHAPQDALSRIITGPDLSFSGGFFHRLPHRN